MEVLILKLNATGDVVRNTPLLRRLDGPVTWVTAAMNLELLTGVRGNLRCLSWDERVAALDRTYDLVLNLEDDLEVASFARQVTCGRIFGAYVSDDGQLKYSVDSRGWFDLSLISVHGRKKADELKLQNRRSCQDLIFDGLGLQFEGESYCLPEVRPSKLRGDVAMTPVAGPVWPMKNWAHYDELRARLEALGLTVNTLPRRATLLEHLADVQAHRCLVGGDSLPMHLALGSRIPCVTIFNCTSPWEIYGYGLQSKVISPLLNQFFYKRGMDERATTAVRIDDVLPEVLASLERRAGA